MPAERIEAIVKRTRNGGTEIVSHLKSGGAYYAPSAAIVEMVRAIHRDENKILPCSALMDGQYGVDGVYLGVPCVLGSQGLVRIVRLNLSNDELAALRRSAEAVRELRDRVSDYR